MKPSKTQIANSLNQKFFIWWSWAELNRRPSACKADALPTELQPQATLIVRIKTAAGRFHAATQLVGLG